MERPNRGRTVRTPRDKSAARAAASAASPAAAQPRTTLFSKSGSATTWTAAIRHNFRRDPKTRHAANADIPFLQTHELKENALAMGTTKSKASATPASEMPSAEGIRKGKLTPRTDTRNRTTDALMATNGHDKHNRRHSPSSDQRKEGSALPLFTGWVRYYSSYGKNIGMDLFSLLHNAVRREFVNLYCILSSMANREQQISLADFRRFFKWFEVFEAFLIQALVIQEDVVIAWIASLVPMPPTLVHLERTDRRGEIFEIVNAIKDLRGIMAREKPIDMIAALVETTDCLAERSIAWFESLESQLPDVVAEVASIMDKEAVELQIVHSFTSGKDPHNSLQLLTGWMDDPELLHHWVNRFVLSKTTRKCFYAYIKKFDDVHVGYAEEMFQALVRQKDAEKDNAYRG